MNKVPSTVENRGDGVPESKSPCWWMSLGGSPSQRPGESGMGEQWDRRQGVWLRPRWGEGRVSGLGVRLCLVQAVLLEL